MADNENVEPEDQTKDAEFAETENEKQSIQSEEIDDEDIVSEFLGTTDEYDDASSSFCGGHKQYKWEWLTDKEKKSYSKIYAEILMDIGTENRILHSFRRRLLCLTEDNPCPTICEQREIRGLQCCIKMENERLKYYMKRAVNFLANSPCGPWDDIPIPSSRRSECHPTELGGTMCDTICEALLNRNKSNVCKNV